MSAAFNDAHGTVISADGRFVAFTGYENDGTGTERWNVYAIDRELHASFDISVRTDGARDDSASGSSMSADGSAIAFNGGTDVLQEGTPLAASSWPRRCRSRRPTPRCRWKADPCRSSHRAGRHVLESVACGGHEQRLRRVLHLQRHRSRHLDVEIPFNYWGESTTYQLWLGSEVVSFQQQVRPILGWLGPDLGPTTGGTPFQITGFGFQDGASVTFDGIPATDIVTSEDGTTLYGVSPPHFSTSVKVVVTNPDGASSLDETWFYYYDETPPVVTANVTGSLGLNGWYTSDVVVQWSVVETDSELLEAPCASGTQTTDVTSHVFSCSASSGGGGITEQVVLRRDATRPSIGITQPQALSYMQGQAVAIDFSCSDDTSGVASCTANQVGYLNTSTPGTFSFVVTAVDHAGNTSQSSVSYSVHGKVDTWLSFSSSPNPSKPNQDVTLTATVSGQAPDGGIPTGLVELRVNGVLVGSAPLVNGVASGKVDFKKGTYSLTATYVGDANFNSSSGTVLHQTK